MRLWIGVSEIEWFSYFFL